MAPGGNVNRRPNAALTAVLAVVAVSSIWWVPATLRIIVGPPDDPWNSQFEFSGAVVDDAGAPVSGARVDYSVETTKLLPKAMLVLPAAGPTTDGSVMSDSAGLFHVRGKGSSLRVREIPASGMKWIQSDDVGEFPASPLYSTRLFDLRTEFGDRYVPDPASPASFVMLRAGKTNVSTLMSRGGKEIRSDNHGRFHLITNKPFWPRRTEPRGILYLGTAATQPYTDEENHGQLKAENVTPG